jgi:hypothetical protein
MTALAHRARTDGRSNNGEAPDPQDPELRLRCLFDPDTVVACDRATAAERSPPAAASTGPR